MQASLCCLRSLLQGRDWQPLEEGEQLRGSRSYPAGQGSQRIFSDPTLVPHLIRLLEKDATHQIAVCDILTSCCRSTEQQNLLVTSGVLQVGSLVVYGRRNLVIEILLLILETHCILLDQ